MTAVVDSTGTVAYSNHPGLQNGGWQHTLSATLAEVSETRQGCESAHYKRRMLAKDAGVGDEGEGTAGRAIAQLLAQVGPTRFSARAGPMEVRRPGVRCSSAASC